MTEIKLYQEDDAAPDAYIRFDNEVFEETGYLSHIFKRLAVRSETDDGMTLEWRLGVYRLTISGDFPFHTLYKTSEVL